MVFFQTLKILFALFTVKKDTACWQKKFYFDWKISEWIFLKMNAMVTSPVKSMIQWGGILSSLESNSIISQNCNEWGGITWTLAQPWNLFQEKLYSSWDDFFLTCVYSFPFCRTTHGHWGPPLHPLSPHFRHECSPIAQGTPATKSCPAGRFPWCWENQSCHSSGKIFRK